MAIASNRVTDGFTSLDGGMDGGSSTNLLPRNQYSLGANATCRGGYLGNRPGFRDYNLSFTTDDDRIYYTSKKFQGGKWYVQDKGDPFAIVAVGGHIFRVVLTSEAIATVEDLTPTGDPNKSDLPRVWMEQADKYMIVQDGLDAPFIYDGSTLRRSKPEAPHYEIPTGTVMAYGYGRIFVARGEDIAAGNILDASNAANVITFTEINQFQDSFAVPITSGTITAMVFTAILDTSLGQGALQVHTTNGDIVTINITTDRKSWTSTNIQQIGLRGSAALSQESVVNVNDDTWFRARDGIRSFIVAQRFFFQGGMSWGNTPQSREIRDLLAYDSQDLLKFCSGIWFDNRLLMTINPQGFGTNVYFQGIGVLDFDILSSIGGSTHPPAYDGLWTGRNITLLTKTYFGQQERAFVFTYSQENGNGISELTTDEIEDSGECPIVSIVETGSYNFSQLANLKQLMLGDLWIDDVQGSVDFTVWFKPDQYPFWILWQTFNETQEQCVELESPSVACQVPVTIPPQYRSRIRLQQPELAPDNEMAPYPLDRGYDFRFRIQWAGHARLKGLRLQATTIPEETTGTTP